MSAVVEQEDVADTGKDDENNLITDASSVPGNARGDTAGAHDPSPDTAIESILKALSPEKLSDDISKERTCNETDKQAGDSYPIKPSAVSLNDECGSNEIKKDNVPCAADDTLADKSMQFAANITDSNPDVKNLDVSKPVLGTGYKETVIDDASDSEIELRWSDDENDDEMNAEPLSNEALKRLDIELGIADADSTENSTGTRDVITVTSTPESLFKIENSKEFLFDDKKSEAGTLAQNSLKTEKPKEIVDDNMSETVESNTTAQISMEIENTKIIVADNNSESFKTVCDEAVNRDEELDIDTNEKYHKINTETDVEIKQMSKSNEQDSHPIKVPINLVGSCSEPINIGANVESNLESAKINVTEADEPMDKDIASVQCELQLCDAKTVSDKTESFSQSQNNEKLTHLVKQMDVDEEDKISEIDIDETIVDLKNLIDQDEDTVKQLGLDVGKSSNKNDIKDENELILKTDEKETKSAEYESESVKLANVDLESVKIYSATTINAQNEDAQPMAEDICTKTSLETDLCEKPLQKSPIQKTKITELTSPSEDDFKITNDQIKDTNYTLEYVSRTDKIDDGSGNVTTKEPDGVNVAKNDNTKIIIQTAKDQIDIQPKTDNKVAIEEYESDKIKEKLTLQLDKDETKNDKNITTKDPTDQKLAEKDNVENEMTKQIENLVGRNLNASKILETLSEPNVNENSETVSKVTEKDTEEFIIPDVTNDSIKINTDHRINRPDVMLDIPTQEFDFDDFDDTSDMQSDKPDKNDSDLTTKTVTEIVNQLANETDNMDTDEIESTDVNVTKTVSDDQIKEINDIPIQDANIHNSTTNDIEKTSIEKKSDTTEKQEAESKKDDNTGAITQKDDKDVKSTENTEKQEKTLQTDDKALEKDPKSLKNLEKTKHYDTQSSTSSEGTKDTPNKIQIIQENDKSSEVGMTSAETVQRPENIDPQPSTSEGIAEEDQEVTDSLGLLAESARVMDDDDDEEQEPEEDEVDDGDGDDDDDFDPDDEQSSNQTGEHSEESNPPHSELDIQEDGIDIEFNSDVDKIGLDSNDATFDASQKTDSKSVESPENVSETSTDGTGVVKERRSSILADLLTKPAAEMNLLKPEDVKTLDKSIKNEISKPVTVENIVDLEGSSSEDESKDSTQEAPSVTQKYQKSGDIKIIKVNIEGEPVKVLDYEAAQEKPKDDKDKPKTGEVFNLDSDDDDKKGDKKDVSIVDTPRENGRCVNYDCTSDESVVYYLADRMTTAYYGAARRRNRVVCQNCLDVVNSRNEGLVSGIKDLRPLMSLRMARPNHTLLEISDSDSEGEDEPVGEDGARFLEDKLTDMMNEVWSKYNMDSRLKESEDYFTAELEKMQKQSEEVDKLLRDCQVATDEMRVQFYSNFKSPRHELPGISIHDTPIASYACLETEDEISEATQFSMRYPKRRSSSASEPPPKMQAVAHDEKKMTRSSSMIEEQAKTEDDRDISVVRLSAEAAPADLPPPGDLVKPPLRAGALVYAMKNQYGAWLKAKILEVQAKTSEAQYTICRVRFDHKVKNPWKTLSARSIAYTEPSEVRLTIGTRVIALFKNSENSTKKGEFYYSGVIAEIPNPVNGYRYLVFFDDGYAQYVEHRHTRLVCESKTLVWEEVHPFSRDFVCNYLMKYPERPMVRVHPGQEVNVERNGQWLDTKVIKVDAALVQVQFPDSRTEWIYRGATRLKPLFNELLAAKRSDRARLPRSTKANTKTNVPYVEYTRSDDQVKIETQSAEDLRRQRSVAKKSTTIAQQISNAATDGVISRVVFYTPKNSVRPLKMVAHACGPHCRRSDLLSLQDLRTYNPLTKPLLSGWERQIVRHKSSRGVMYRAPCGRRVRSMRELHRYLRLVRSDMPVDLFDFNANTHCLAEFVLNKTNVQKKDLSHGKENVPVPCVNYYDHSLPEFCSYNTERTPTAGVPLNLDTEFLCGCDCDDDCADKTKCACWKMTLEGAKTIGIDGINVGYHYRRLPEPLPSGIYECNSRCKCKSTCLNRVVQNPLQLKLQVFKTLNRGWGIRALNDVPKGAFICIYAGNLLTDATANLDGLNEGDEYLAELDYIEVVEAMKEGYEDDIPEVDKELDKKELKKSESEPESESTESEGEESRDKTDIQDGDFQPGCSSFGLTEFNKRLRRRDKKKKDEQNKEQTSEDKSAKKEDGEECITISDDEEVRVSQREPSRFAAQETMTENKTVSKYRSIRSYFGKDEACYIMDAKVQGNIGRYLNHSCSPNVFVQNVFVDTHDPRFPWVSFFALHHIRAGTELTWNYNYDIGSVPGKVLYCYCGAPNCRRRLL